MNLREVFLHKFPPRLLTLRAYAYMRQSSPKQLKENVGSTMYQRDLLEVANEIGFAPESIEAIDCDTGTTGSSIDHRVGFRYILEEIKRGRAGLVLVTNLMRANRNAREQLELFEYCKIFEVPLWYDERLHDPTDINELLSMYIGAVFGEHDNTRRRADMVRGRYAKARAGYVASSLPRGFVKAGNSIEKDPDPAVQEAVQNIFRTFLRCGNVNRTWKELLAEGAMLPTRKVGKLRWVKPKKAAIRHVLTNPIYAGRYEFRRQVVDPKLGRDSKGRWRRRLAELDEIIVSPASFEAYVAPEQFAEIQDMLARNRPRRRGSRRTESPALCQGRLRCVDHARYVMTPKPSSASEDYCWHYFCTASKDEPGGCRRSVATQYVDRMVLDAVLAKISPPRLKIVRELFLEARAGEIAEHFRREGEVDRARVRERQLEQLYLSEAPENAAVRQRVAERWNEAIVERKRLEAMSAERSEKPTLFDDDRAFSELASLCQNVEGILALPTTMNSDRKEVIGCLVDEVILETCTPEEVRVRIVWSDGAEDEVASMKRWGHAQKLIAAWQLEGVSVAETTRRLNTMGILTRKMNPWTEESVAHARWRAGHRQRQGASSAPAAMEQAS